MNFSRKKICWVVASPLTIRFFLMGHIEMLAREVELTVITHTNDPEFLKWIEGNLRVIPLVIERNVSPLKDLKTLIQLFFIFRRERYDLVHSLSPKTGLLGMVAAWFARIPLRVHTFQGEVWITRTGLWRKLLKALDSIMASCANHLLVVSRSEESFLVNEGVVAAGRMRILANGSICGVDIDRFSPNEKMRTVLRAQLQLEEADRVILYVGRLNTDKGLLDLASAFARIASEQPGIHLLFVGPDEDSMRSKIEKICRGVVENRLHFVGYTDNPEHYMAASDILCLPSYREGFGMVLVEAAAMGLPTIGSRIYGIVDAMVDGETGLLFEPANVEDLISKLLQILKNPALARQLGYAGQLRARKDFSNHLVSSALLAYYKQLLLNQKKSYT